MHEHVKNFNLLILEIFSLALFVCVLFLHINTVGTVYIPVHKHAKMLIHSRKHRTPKIEISMKAYIDGSYNYSSVNVSLSPIISYCIHTYLHNNRSIVV